MKLAHQFNWEESFTQQNRMNMFRGLKKYIPYCFLIFAVVTALIGLSLVLLTVEAFKNLRK